METQVYGGINYDRNGSVGAKFSAKPGYANRPVNYVRPYDALRFINWLQNGQGNGDTETGTFTMLQGGPNSGTSTIIDTATRAQWAAGTTMHWVLPSIDEWFKAAYHKNDGVTGNYWLYPTRSNSPPGRDMSEATNPGNNANYYVDGGPYPIDSGTYYTTVVGEFELSQSPYGTFDQAGNVLEWHEWSTKVLQPGCSFDWPVSNMNANTNVRLALENEQMCVGFRVGLIGVPEPSSVALLIAAAISLIAYAWQGRMV
jgi:formylglycine-generating enzyme